MEEPIKLEENWRNPDGTLKPGHPDLGGGRPKGKTIKESDRHRRRRYGTTGGVNLCPARTQGGVI